MHHRISIIILFFIAGFITVDGQNGVNSFYSRYGLGDPVNSSFMHLRSMGSIAAAYNDPYLINIVNPASYSHLRAVAFDVGVNIKMANVSDGTNSQGIESGNLEYISFALPLINKVNEILEREERSYNVATAFTLMPHSRVGYDISSLEGTEDFGNIIRNFKGNGGSYKFMWGNSVRYKDFSFGLNLGYLFGKISYERNVLFEQTEYAYDSRFSSEYSISGFLWNTGVQFTHTFNKVKARTQAGVRPKSITIGAYYGSNTGFGTNSETLEISSQTISGQGTFQDTLSSSFGIEGDGTLPGELGFGIMYKNGEKIKLGINYSSTSWSKYKNDAKPESLSDASSIGVGGSYCPNYLSQNSYWDRVYYRFGFNYNQDPRTVIGNDIKSYSVNVGLGLPFLYQRSISHANLGLEFGKKGGGAVIEETFVKINIGFTFNDSQWFLKRRYD